MVSVDIGTCDYRTGQITIGKETETQDGGLLYGERSIGRSHTIGKGGSGTIGGILKDRSLWNGDMYSEGLDKQSAVCIHNGCSQTLL